MLPFGNIFRPPLHISKLETFYARPQQGLQLAAHGVRVEGNNKTVLERKPVEGSLEKDYDEIAILQWSSRILFVRMYSYVAATATNCGTGKEP